MAQKLAPAEKNSTDISAASAVFCISGRQPGCGDVGLTSFLLNSGSPVDTILGIVTVIKPVLR